jgi:FlaA1/EpsC-like NDP-sugar epimerase
MNHALHLDDFISRVCTGRAIPLTTLDMARHAECLKREIEGQKVLVIGGAGSIGTSFIKALLRYAPSALYVVDHNENGLTELVRDLRSSQDTVFPAVFRTYPMGFGDAVFEKMLKREGPFEIVANFAAHKHVRSEKDRYTIEAMLENNVLRTFRLLELLKEFAVPKHFFCVSTDKASNPANIMGASKQLMEQVILAFNGFFPVKTARFANVAFSQGSLPDGFLKRLARQQPLSAPKNIRRYFVSPKEAGEICLLSCVVAASGQIVFPRLEANSQVTFTEIAEKLLLEVGYMPDFCQSESEAREKAICLSGEDRRYPIFTFESQTDGEKFEESFYDKNDLVSWENFENLGVIYKKELPEYMDTKRRVEALQHILRNSDFQKIEVIAHLAELVLGFRHLEKGRNLDEIM